MDRLYISHGNLLTIESMIFFGGVEQEHVIRLKTRELTIHEYCVNAGSMVFYF